MGHMRMTILALCMAGLGLAACVRSESKAQTGTPAETGAPIETASAAPDAPKPALWRTGDADTKVYLFGTVHILPPDLEWQTETMTSALDEASVVYFETDVDPNPVEMISLVTRVGLYPKDQSLSDQLNTEQRMSLSRAAAEVSLPVASLDRMRPWLAATTLSERLIVKAGYDPMSGVERKLHPMAMSAGKAIRKFETVEDQIMLFAGLPEDTQLRYLIKGMEDVETDTQLLHAMVAAWTRGDIEALNRIMIEDELAEEPQIYDALLVRRNRTWTEALDDLIKTETGVFFVAVGAGHLTGKDSVVAMLEQRGVRSDRVQ